MVFLPRIRPLTEAKGRTQKAKSLVVPIELQPCGTQAGAPQAAAGAPVVDAAKANAKAEQRTRSDDKAHNNRSSKRTCMEEPDLISNKPPRTGKIRVRNSCLEPLGRLREGIMQTEACF